MLLMMYHNVWFIENQQIQLIYKYEFPLLFLLPSKYYEQHQKFFCLQHSWLAVNSPINQFIDLTNYTDCMYRQISSSLHQQQWLTYCVLYVCITVCSVQEPNTHHKFCVWHSTPYINYIYFKPTWKLLSSYVETFLVRVFGICYIYTLSNNIHSKRVDKSVLFQNKH